MRPHTITLALIAALVVVAAAQEQDDAADAARLIEVLELREGSRLADIGAGSGELTIRLARHVGTRGRVFSTEINPQRLIEIRKAVSDAQMHNVTVIEGGSSQTNTPAECCDGIFLRHVYHHFGDLPSMNASLKASLKPKGRLAIVDFAPRSRVSAPAGRRSAGESHGVMPGTVIEELKAAGFVRVEQQPWPSSGYFLITASRPD